MPPEHSTQQLPEQFCVLGKYSMECLCITGKEEKEDIKSGVAFVFK